MNEKYLTSKCELARKLAILPNIEINSIGSGVIGFDWGEFSFLLQSVSFYISEKEMYKFYELQLIGIADALFSDDGLVGHFESLDGVGAVSYIRENLLQDSKGLLNAG